MDFLKNQLECGKASHTLLTYYLLSDLVQFVWMSVLTQGLLIQRTRQDQFRVWGLVLAFRN